MALSDVDLEPLTAASLTAATAGLAALLGACVEAGASVGFLTPLAEAEAVAFWHGLVPDVETGTRMVLVARQRPGGRIVGTGQLRFVTNPNGRHRAEVCKVMVLPTHRRTGIATRLVGELERVAQQRSIRLLYLDTSEGPGGACDLYEKLGYSYAGGIPDYALDPDGTPAKNAIFYKLLG